MHANREVHVHVQCFLCCLHTRFKSTDHVLIGLFHLMITQGDGGNPQFSVPNDKHTTRLLKAIWKELMMGQLLGVQFSMMYPGGCWSAHNQLQWDKYVGRCHCPMNLSALNCFSSHWHGKYVSKCQ